jgi:aspartate/methionine/tyrosine aminotransferase
MMLNFGNPLCFLPSADEAWKFASEVAEWNRINPTREITVCVDGAYDDLFGPEGYRFVGFLLQAGVTTTYIHPRTKEEFATGSRGGEVLCNNPAVRQLFNAFKADYIGSDSTLEQEIALYMHSAQSLDKEKKIRCDMIRERKEFFWSLLGRHAELAKIHKDTAPFYRPTGPFYIFLNLTSLIPAQFADSLEFCVAMAKLGVILIPGTLFDVNPTSSSGLNKVCARISFASLDSKSWQSQLDKVVTALLKVL